MKTGIKPKTIKCVENKNGCWEVINHALVKGYPVKHVNQRQERISHLIVINRGETIPSGMMVLHHCDNPLCIKSEHLYVGTPQQNSDEKKARGRMHNQYGEKKPKL